MNKNRKLKDKILNLFFEEDNRTEEESEKDRRYNAIFKNVIVFAFFFNSISLSYILMNNHFTFVTKFEMISFIITLGYGLGLLIYYRN